MTSAPALAARSATRPAAESRIGSSRGWTLYLVLTAVLLPFVRPIGPGQIAIGDLANVAAIAFFGLAMLIRRPPLALPLIVPAFIILGASMIATVNALSPGQSLFTLAQDVYLYLWFVVVANVCAAQPDLKAPRIAWMAMSALIALYGTYDLMHTFHYGFAKLLSPSGERAEGTFGNANFFADYMVLSFFVVLSLGREVRWLWRWPALGALLLGLVASKSLGGLLSMLVGASTWLVVRALTRRVSRLSLLAAVLVVAGFAALGLFVTREWGLGEQGLNQVAKESVVGRFGKSSAGRLQIWTELRRRFEQAPLGIGPGNSSQITLSVENRERRGGSIQGKEAHNDYIGYLVERGPIALFAMVATFGIILSWVASGWRSVRSRRLREGLAGAWAAALAAGVMASATHSLTVEKLHFRHYWLFVALVWGMCAAMRSLDEQPGTAPMTRPKPRHSIPSPVRAAG